MHLIIKAKNEKELLKAIDALDSRKINNHFVNPKEATVEGNKKLLDRAVFLLKAREVDFTYFQQY